MNFFHALFSSPIGLTEADEAYVDAAVDDLLQEPNLFAQRPSDVVTILSLLQEGHRMAPWMSEQMQNPAQERILAQRFLRQYDPMAMPTCLSLHPFLLQ